MIFQALFYVLLGILQVIVAPIPTLPTTPTAVTSAGGWAVTQVDNVIGVLRLVYGTTLLAAMFVIIIALFNFEWVYHSLMWLVRKLPFLSIK